MGSDGLGVMLDWLQENNHLSQFVELAREAWQGGGRAKLMNSVERWLQVESKDSGAWVKEIFRGIHAEFGIKDREGFRTVQHLHMVWNQSTLHMGFILRDAGKHTNTRWDYKLGETKWVNMFGVDGEMIVDLAVLLVIIANIPIE